MPAITASCTRGAAVASLAAPDPGRMVVASTRVTSEMQILQRGRYVLGLFM
jgi:hypothetical protein